MFFIPLSLTNPRVDILESDNYVYLIPYLLVRKQSQTTILRFCSKRIL
jgi:hypothetical protein